MTEDEINRFDGDPHTRKPTPQDDKNGLEMRFGFLKSVNATEDGPYLKRCPQEFKAAYAKWLAESEK